MESLFAEVQTDKVPKWVIVGEIEKSYHNICQKIITKTVKRNDILDVISPNLQGVDPMDEERDMRPPEETPAPAPLFYLGNLDRETIEILVDDKIATGG